MRKLLPYLNLAGRCEAALQFYGEAFGGGVKAMMRFSDAPEPVDDAHKQLIMHSEFEAEGIAFMASDGRPGTAPQAPSPTITLSIVLDSIEEQDRIWAKLSRGAAVGVALHETFWGARFGMLTDQFGIGWMLNCELQKP